jgi:hypothetical protein
MGKIKKYQVGGKMRRDPQVDPEMVRGLEQMREQWRKDTTKPKTLPSRGKKTNMPGNPLKPGKPTNMPGNPRKPGKYTLLKGQAGLNASKKRVGPVDPNGAWTKVQMMNLPPRNVKTKVSLTKDKQQGATSMTAKRGIKVAKAKGGKWIQSAIKKPGALRSALGVKKGQKIPAGKLAAAAKKPGKMRQRARLAQTLGKMRKKK